MENPTPEQSLDKPPESLAGGDTLIGKTEEDEYKEFLAKTGEAAERLSKFGIDFSDWINRFRTFITVFPHLVRYPRFWWFLFSAILAAIGGLYFWIKLIIQPFPTEIPVITWIIGTAFFVLFGFSFVFFFFINSIPKLFRFLLDLATWRVVLLFVFLTVIPGLVLLLFSPDMTKYPVKQVLTTVIYMIFLYSVFLALPMGLIAAATSRQFTYRLIFRLLVAGFLIGSTFLVLLTYLSIVLFQIDWQEELPKILIDSQSRYEAFLELHLFTIMGFWIAWMFWFGGEKYFLERIRTRLSSGIIRKPAEKIKQVQDYLTEELRIHKYYVLFWRYLILFSIFVLIASINPFQFQMLAVINLGLLAIPAAFLIRLTYQYLTIPREVERVTLQLPRYVARSVIQASIVLGLMFIAWWIFHSLFLLNSNTLDLAYNSKGFIFESGEEAVPQIGDFLFYSFALLTNSDYGDLQPVGMYSKFSVMMVTITSLVLLVLFVGAALSFSKNEMDSRSSNSQNDG
jgi:hypothetical protein